jgi:hypothetical protein
MEDGRVDGRSDDGGGIKCVVDHFKEVVELNKCRGDVRWVHDKTIGESKDFDSKEFGEPEEVRVLPNNVTLGKFVLLLIAFQYL